MTGGPTTALSEECRQILILNELATKLLAMNQTTDSTAQGSPVAEPAAVSAMELAMYLLKTMEGPDVDRPELWDFVTGLGDQAGALLPDLALLQPLFWHADLLRAITLATLGRLNEAESILSRLLTVRSQSPW